MKIFLYDFEITDCTLVRKLERNVLGYFEQVSDGHYVCKGYRQPLLAHVSDGHAYVCDPFKYNGSYTYNGHHEITLHSTYGRLKTYKKMTIFGLPFMVCTNMSDDDAILSAMTDIKFIKSLIRALA
jgi:hypothetical protein